MSDATDPAELRRRNIRTALLLGCMVALFYGSFFLVMS